MLGPNSGRDCGPVPEFSGGVEDGHWLRATGVRGYGVATRAHRITVATSDDLSYGGSGFARVCGLSVLCPSTRPWPLFTTPQMTVGEPGRP
jgi:hypothetical protein